jgi:hypothetical protein
MKTSTDPSRQFVQFIQQRTSASTQQIVDGVQTVPSEADGVGESRLQESFTSIADLASFMQTTMRHHPELRDAKTFAGHPELEAEFVRLEQAGEQVPAECREVTRGILGPLQRASGVELMPSAVVSGDAGMFEVTLSRMGEAYNDKAPEPSGIGEPRQRIFVDTTPGVDGIQFFVEDVSPRPRPEYLQLIASSTGRLPEAVLRDVKMYDASAENPVKQLIANFLQRAHQGIEISSGRPDDELSKAELERLGQLETEQIADEKSAPKLRAALSEVLMDGAQKQHPHEETEPKDVIDHGNGLWSIPMQSRIINIDPDKPDREFTDAGTVFIDLRPGEAGYCSYYQAENGAKPPTW